MDKTKNTIGTGSDAEAWEMELMIIPTPKQVSGRLENGSFASGVLEASVGSMYEAFDGTTAVFADYAKRIHGVEIAVKNGEDSGITLWYEDAMDEGAYRLVSTENGVRIYASDVCGVHYALASALQMMRVEGEIRIPLVEITDAPDVSYRGLMVDLARQWHPFDRLLAHTDLCYLYKVNYLHLHFADDPMYTLPSKILPDLSADGRHYTEQELEYLNEYTRARGIAIVPSIEMPGHARSLTTAYPELFANTALPEEADRPMSPKVICVGKEGIMDTLRALVEEVISYFPYSRYFHLGADEARIHEWEHCVDCTRYMKENRIRDVYELYSDFVRRMTDVVCALGKTPIVWEGFPKVGADAISREVIVGEFETMYHLPPDLLSEGFKLINCTWNPLYITPTIHWEVEEILDWNLYRWRGINPDSAAFEAPLSVEATSAVLGAQLCAWECRYEEEIEPVKNNLAALAERTWTKERRVSDGEFRAALAHALSLVDRILPTEVKQETKL